jgi:hypothetical protein
MDTAVRNRTPVFWLETLDLLLFMQLRTLKCWLLNCSDRCDKVNP